MNDLLVTLANVAMAFGPSLVYGAMWTLAVNYLSPFKKGKKSPGVVKEMLSLYAIIFTFLLPPIPWTWWPASFGWEVWPDACIGDFLAQILGVVVGVYLIVWIPALQKK